MIKLICTLIGTYIGAGFASGKEIYLFFFKYNIYGFFGILISSTFIGYIVDKVLVISLKNGINNYNEFLDYIINNNKIKKVINNMIKIFLAISFCVMVSGFSTFLYQEFNINIFFGVTIFLFFSSIVLKNKATGIIKINNILIPIMIFIIFFIVIKNIKISEFNIFKILKENTNENKYDLIGLRAIFYSILYANYNLISIIPIAVTMSNYFKNKKIIKYSSILYSIIIFLLSISIYLILNQANYELENIEMPVVFIISKYGIGYKFIYCTIISIAMYTTALSDGYGYLLNYEENQKTYNRKLIELTILSFLILPIGFSKLIEILYPFFGIIGIYQCFKIVRIDRKNK